ncbi:cytochrome b/b6 domain-containing protein [Thermosyntropha sp.]|uniref:formate dehydrogenase subunit gamma n=1 Tax=Thermosyntropha sp. TaxID=2740820 RepID=UPI0025DF5371|nr:cytochrome b/b6 domain-containing protein [Thermosyntropha sp.]MBO8159277.1 cytochrome b/b6 domain-containing protein [Thermosyntropha sp.]
MQLLTEYREDVERVERFNFVSRLTHWGHTVTFLLCLLTGLILFLDGVDWLAAIFGGYNSAGLIHRISAVFMTLFIIIFIIFDFKGIKAWIKDILSFGKNDIIFILKFPLEFLGFEVKMPPQTRFNGGEKGNSILTPTCVILLVLSGYIMWFPAAFPPGLVRVAYPVHDIAMILSTFMVCMHGYLGSFHPGSGESFWGMWKGTVRADWAKHHHPIWYEETYGEKKAE